MNLESAGPPTVLRTGPPATGDRRLSGRRATGAVSLPGARPPSVNRVCRSVLLGLAALCLAITPALAQAAGRPQRQALSLILLPAALLGWGALQAVVAILFPRWTGLTRESLETRRGWCLGWGAAIAVLALLVLVAGAAAKGPLGALAAIIALVVTLAGAFGFAGAAEAVGARLLPAAGPLEDRTALQALVGGGVLSFAFLAPILGQLLGLLVFLAALGAAARALAGGLRAES
jgi:hypothetical protein